MNSLTNRAFRFFIRKAGIHPPDVASKWSDVDNSGESESLSLTAGFGYSRGSDYCIARREFLKSYHLSEGEFGITEKVRRSVKGMTAIVVRVRDEMSKRRVRVRVYRFVVVCPALFIVKFLVPCIFIQKIDAA